jgi:hypothetical protein
MATLQISESPNRRVPAAANRFHEAAKTLDAVGTLTVSSVVNTALALELYLKSFDADIHFKEGRVIRGGAVTLSGYELLGNESPITHHQSPTTASG